MRILFVHGTGVRRERHDAVFTRIQQALVKRLPEAEVSPCFWGEEYGATLSRSGRSIPGNAGRNALDYPSAASPEALEPAAWLLLMTDPLCELRILTETEDESAADCKTLGVRTPGENLAELFEALSSASHADDELAKLLADTGLAEHYDAALRLVGHSAEFDSACAGATETSAAAELAATAARSVVGAMLAAAGEDSLCSAAERDRAVDILSTRLGGTGKFPGGRVAAFLGRLAMRVSTQPVLNHWRVPITQGTTPALGDILLYQSRGGPLRQFLTRQITAGPQETVVIGHSLGGVALVDLLAMSAMDGHALTNVTLLVTVGSQAPFLHELGALTGLTPGQSLPRGFPRWLNIFDRQDVLGFLAQPVFPDEPRVIDFEVRTGQPFPACHGAYWKKDAVYDRIAKAVKEPG